MITVNHNKEVISGSLNGKSYAIPFKQEWYDKLDTKAKAANTAKTPAEKKTLETSFQNSLNAMKGASKSVEQKKEVIVGTNQLSIVENPSGIKGQYYLYNGKQYSRFYIPTPLYQRIQTLESKGLDTTPLIKFHIRANRGKVMTQEKYNRLADYINKTYVDQDIVNDLVEQGFTKEKAVEQATVLQVPITLEGLMNTYKVSTLIGDNGIDQLPKDWDSEDEIEDEDENEEGEEESTPSESEIDTSEFKFVPIRNKRGHFLKRASDEYVAEYNKQLEEFKASKGDAIVMTTVKKKVGKQLTTVKVEATPKYAEQYVFQPAYQGKSGDAFYCGDKLGHIIQVGKLHKLDSWDQVNTNDSNSGYPGLHVGGRDYIKGYEDNRSDGLGSTIVHNVFVDPQYVGAVVSVESGDGALRVKEYFVHSSFIGINGGNYNSSDYAKQTDAEWDNQILEAMITVEEAEKKIAEIRKAAEKAQAVLDAAF